jgi:hypothetical protein
VGCKPAPGGAAARRTYELGQHGQHAVVGQEEVVEGAELALGLERLVLGLELADADDLGHAAVLLQLLQPLLGLLVALARVVLDEEADLHEGEWRGGRRMGAAGSTRRRWGQRGPSGRAPALASTPSAV